MHLEFKSTLGENGRVVLPAKLRHALDISSGDQIVFVLENQELKVIPLKKTIKHFQSLVSKLNKDKISLVDSLLASRRRELENE